MGAAQTWWQKGGRMRLERRAVEREQDLCCLTPLLLCACMGGPFSSRCPMAGTPHLHPTSPSQCLGSEWLGMGGQSCVVTSLPLTDLSPHQHVTSLWLVVPHHRCHPPMTCHPLLPCHPYWRHPSPQYTAMVAAKCIGLWGQITWYRLDQNRAPAAERRIRSASSGRMFSKQGRGESRWCCAAYILSHRPFKTMGPSTPETNSHSSQIEQMNCHWNVW